MVVVLAGTLTFTGCQSEEDAITPTIQRESASSEITQSFHPIAITSSGKNLRVAPMVDMNANVGGCLAELTSIGGVSLGGESKLRAVSHGTGDLNEANECDYFVGFPGNSYDKVVVVYFPDDPDENPSSMYPNRVSSLDLAYRLIRLIRNRKTNLVSPGFNNGLAKARYYYDGRTYIVFGNGRTDYYSEDYYIPAIAAERGMSVSALLAKYVYMGN